MRLRVADRFGVAAALDDGELLEVSLEASGRSPAVQRWIAELAEDPDVARVEQR